MMSGKTYSLKTNNRTVARIRTIKPDFFKHEDLAELPSMVRLLFIGLWTQADRAGRLEDRPKRLKVEIFPYEDYNIEEGLELLATHGFIVRYKTDDKKLPLIQISSFTKHQQPNTKEKESTLPAPCQHSASITGKGMDIGNGVREVSAEGDSPAPDHFDLGDGLQPIVLSPNRPTAAPSVVEVQKAFEFIKSPQYLRQFFEHYESTGWTDGNGRSIIMHWQGKVSKWASTEKEKEGKAAAKEDERRRKEEERSAAKKPHITSKGVSAAELIAQRNQTPQ